VAEPTPIAIALTDDERFVLERGLVEWAGPARCTDALAVAMGFADVDDLFGRTGPLLDALRSGAMAAGDWRRVVLATEFVFASDLVGAGHDWSATTGLSDEATIAALRSVQRKLPAAVRAAGA